MNEFIPKIYKKEIEKYNLSEILSAKYTNRFAQLVYLQDDKAIPIELFPLTTRAHEKWQPINGIDPRDIRTISDTVQSSDAIPIGELQLIGAEAQPEEKIDISYSTKFPQIDSAYGSGLRQIAHAIQSRYSVARRNEYTHFAINFATREMEDDTKKDWRPWIQQQYDKVRHITLQPTVNMYRRVSSFEDRLNALLEKAGMQAVMKSFEETETILSKVAKEIEE